MIVTVGNQRREMVGEPHVQAEPTSCQASEGAVDAATLVIRLGCAIDDIARMVDELGAGLAPTLAAAAERDPALLVRAQAFDAVSQSLHSLTAFLAEVGKRQIGIEPLHLGDLAAALPSKALSDRLSGIRTRTEEAALVLF